MNIGTPLTPAETRDAVASALEVQSRQIDLLCDLLTQIAVSASALPARRDILGIAVTARQVSTMGRTAAATLRRSG